jgi:hypothetical protein
MKKKYTAVATLLCFSASLLANSIQAPKATLKSVTK